MSNHVQGRALKTAQDNLREAWSALAMIRETIETLGPVGAVKAYEHLDGPTFMHEAEALVEGIRALASRSADVSGHMVERLRDQATGPDSIFARAADEIEQLRTALRSPAERSDKCAKCGHPREEHSYNGACYGLCGEFIPHSPPVQHPSFSDIERVIVNFYEAHDVPIHEADGEWIIAGDGQFSLTALALAIRKVMPRVSAPIEWRCFHCDEVLTDRETAKLHFGDSLQGDPICRLNAMQGGLVKLVRDQEDELQRFRTEDTASCREFYRLGAEHQQALRREEEKGYARGLSDARACNEAAQEAYEALLPFGNVALDILEKRPGWANPVFTANWGGEYPLRYFDFEKAAAAVLKLRGIDCRPRWRHCKRETTYVEIGRGKLQTAQILTDQTAMVLYRSSDDGSLWVRAEAEFEDGRFELLSPEGRPATKPR